MLLTIDSAGQVLSMFTSESPEHGATEVALAIGVSKSKAHALLMSLSTVGLLRRTERGRYRVGWRVLSLNRVLAETTEFHRHARPVMRVLYEQAGEPVRLGALDDGKVIYIDGCGGAPSGEGSGAPLGSHVHLHCTAVGKVLLASLPPASRDGVISRHGLPAITARTITDRTRLEEHLDVVRARGLAVDRGEERDGHSCVAAPIVAPGPVVVAALGIWCRSDRFREDVHGPAVIRAARYISRRLASSEEQTPAVQRAERLAISA